MHFDPEKVVTINYNPVWTELEWAKQFCKSYITNTATINNHNSNEYKINYYFGNKKDATMFRIRWTE